MSGVNGRCRSPYLDAEEAAGEIKNLSGLAQENQARIIASEHMERLDRIERTQVAILDRLDSLNSRQVVKEYYSTEEVAARVGRSGYQVRAWCREGRIRAEKRLVGRGRHKEWMVPHAELIRYESEGLLPRPGHR